MQIAPFVVPFLLIAGVAAAQPTYIDHRTYPADFAAIAPGDLVDDRPGLVWQHDGRGWYWAQAGTPTPSTVPTNVTCPPSANPYTLTEGQSLACAPRPLLPFVATNGMRFGYTVGEVYGPKGYATGLRVAILSVAGDLNTPRRVVTAKWLRGPTDAALTVFTDGLTVFFEDEGPYVPLRPGESR